MATFKSQVQNLNAFPDNDSGEIQASDGRNAIQSLYPYQQSFDPGPNDDSINSAAEPDATGFGIGSTWLNTVNGNYWICKDGAVTSAVWEQLYPQGGGVDLFAARIDGIGECTPLVSTSITTTTGLDSTGFDVSGTDGEQLGIPMSAVGSGFGSSAEIIDWTVGGTHGGVDVNSTATTTDPAVYTPIAYSWTELSANAQTGELQVKPGGRSYTYLTGPAYQLGGNPLVPTPNGTIVWMRGKGIVQGIPTFEFVMPPPQTGSSPVIGSPDQTSSTTINYYGNASFPTAVNYDYNSVVTFNYGVVITPNCLADPTTPNLIWRDCAGNLFENDPSGDPHQISGGSTWIPFRFSYTDLTTVAGYTVFLLFDYPADAVPLRCVQYIDTDFNPGGTSMYLGWIKASDGSQRTALGSFHFFSAGEVIKQFDATPVLAYSGVTDGLYALCVYYSGPTPTVGEIHGAFEVYQL